MIRVGTLICICLVVALATSCVKRPIKRIYPLEKVNAYHQLKEKLDSQSSRERVQAIIHLSRLGNISVPTLMECLRDDRFGVSFAASRCLANMHPKPVFEVERLLAYLNNDHREVRGNAAYVLQILGPYIEISTVEDFLAKIQNHNQKALRSLFVRVIPAVQDPLPFLEKLANSRKTHLVDNAVSALGQIGRKSKKVTPILVAIAQNRNRDLELRSLAVHTLAFTKDPSAVPHLIELTRDREAKIRIAACHTLGTYAPKTTEVIAALEKAMEDETSKTVRLTAVKSIEQIHQRSRPKPKKQ